MTTEGKKTKWLNDNIKYVNKATKLIIKKEQMIYLVLLEMCVQLVEVNIKVDFTLS